MSRNSFGTLFRITTFGESHGPGLGCIVDGCPAGLEISREEIQEKLDRRKPGTGKYVSPRKENDAVELLSGVFQGKTTGAPIALLIRNHDADSSAYEATKHILKPGHAHFTYLQKYGHFDFRGSGRASARETAARVAAGAIAEKLLSTLNIEINAFLASAGTYSDPAQIETLLQKCIDEKESVGGVVECHIHNVPAGLGDPIYEKMEAKLASAMMSLPASKAFEIGDGIKASTMKGSEHNDRFTSKEGVISTTTNHAGGLLGGITTCETITLRVHFKPTSSIGQSQETVDTEGNPTTLTLPANSRHDPCVAIRAVPVVRAMCALVIADAYLLNKTAQLSSMNVQFSERT